ncbi:MAG TPA: ABC transporter substrate-binding protein [Polyangiaceae bacterium]|nr:ABC transporter substrate-binding protein [Polyangiaceae bacterium]
MTSSRDPVSSGARCTRRGFLDVVVRGGLACAGANVFGCSRDTGAAATNASPSASASAAADARETVRVGYLPITDAAPLLVAHGRGFFDAEGLAADRPVLLRSWPQIAEAFQARQIDVAHLLMPMTVWLRFSEHYPVKVVAWDHVDGSALTVTPSVQAVSDLAGRVVAVPFWYSIHNVILQELLRKNGLTPVLRGEPSLAKREVKLVVMAPPDMPPALASGAIAGYIVADPFNALAEIAGSGKILRFTGDVWQNHACCVVVLHEDDVRGRPAWSQKVVNAIARAQLYARENRDATATLLSKDGSGYLPQPKAAIARALAHYDAGEYAKSGAIQHPDGARARIDFEPFPFASYTEKLVALLKSTRVEGDTAFLAELDPARVHAELVDDRFARAAIQALGGPDRFGLPASLARTERVSP